MTVVFDPNETWDNMHGPSRPGSYWTTDNVGEAAPGVLSPLGASIWGTIGERATRAAFVGIGVLPRAESGLPDRIEDRYARIFCGRLAMSIESMTMIGDRLPGTSGQDIAANIYGNVPDDIDYEPTMRRYPAILYNLGRTFFGMPARLERESMQFERFWHYVIDSVDDFSPGATRKLLAESLAKFEAALTLQSLCVIGHAQVMHEALASTVSDAGVGDVRILSGSGGAEMDVITDIWQAANGRLTIDDVIRRHGFHGPLEGEVSSTVWREDRAPLQRLLAQYADCADPRELHEKSLAALPAEQERVLSALPRAKRPGARRVLEASARRIPLRGVAKRSFLQGLDAVRACTRHLGELLAANDLIDDPSDAFYLTTDELLGDLPTDVRDLVAKRRTRREEYQRVSLPNVWKGSPEPVRIEVPDDDAERVLSVQGIGVSAGTIEGIARVVTDPAFADVEPDEILVAPTTDPSWASIMYISAGLVVDIGGPISHAAVVARELGLPCVVNTRSGTRDIRTGDRVRLNGESGVIEILEPVAVATGASTA